MILLFRFPFIQKHGWFIGPVSTVLQVQPFLLEGPEGPRILRVSRKNYGIGSYVFLFAKYLVDQDKTSMGLKSWPTTWYSICSHINQLTSTNHKLMTQFFSHHSWDTPTKTVFPRAENIGNLWAPVFGCREGGPSWENFMKVRDFSKKNMAVDPGKFDKLRSGPLFSGRPDMWIILDVKLWFHSSFTMKPGQSLPTLFKNGWCEQSPTCNYLGLILCH